MKLVYIAVKKIYSLKDIWIFRYSNQKIITLVIIYTGF